MRQCGECQLCCKLLPVKGVQKPAGQRCRFQKFHKGCSVYHTAQMPHECGLWNCRWLINDDAGELARPDRAHYVIDIMPDFVTLNDNETGERRNIQVVQIWCDPDFPKAHRDPALRRWIERRAEQGVAAIVRFDNAKAVIVFAPPLAADRQWHEITNADLRPQHSAAEIFDALG
jgi:hypothetical protein